MKRHMTLRRFLMLAVAGAILAACAPPAPAPTPTPTPLPTGAPIPSTEIPQATAIPDMAEPTPIGPYGPTNFPPDVDPLTGLPVNDPALLNRRPLMIKVSNYPAVVRPQTGLMAADHVWEHEVEGFNITRFTAVFLGNTPDYVGSVRSGRPPDLELVPMYQGLFIASGYSSNINDPTGPKRMRELMRDASWFNRNFSPDFGYGEPYSVRIPQEDKAYEHTLFAVPAELWKLADEKDVNQRPILEGLAFDLNAPQGGTPTAEASIDYPGQVGPVDTWRYDASSERWLRWTDGVEHFDAATNTQLAFTNIVILFARHYETDWLEDEHENSKLFGVAAELQGEGDAILLRDGLRYEIRWQRPDINTMMRFVDAQGTVIPFKPGNTWFNLVDLKDGLFPSTITFMP